MSGGGDDVVVGYRYYMYFDALLGHGPLDAITDIEFGERSAWTGNITANQKFTINAPELFGGDKAEGGIQGDAWLCFGEPDQGTNEKNVEIRGSNIPAFRKLMRFIYDGQVSAINPYIKKFRVKGRRILKGWDGPVWYSSKAAIGNSMNPAHIIYQLITNREWGMGYPATAIDSANFAATADTLYNEGFGLNLKFASSGSAKEFIGIVEEHIAGACNIDPKTGLFILTLLRNDYTFSALPQFSVSNCKLVSWQRGHWGDTVNEVIVEYTDPTTGKAALTAPAQNLGNIQIQGTPISKKIGYPGVWDSALAARLASRDLQALSTPLSKAKIEVDRSAWSLIPGNVIRLNWGPLGVDAAYRILQIDYGNLQDNKIKVDIAEDVFGMPAASYIAQQSVTWNDPSNYPAVSPVRYLMEQTYWTYTRKTTAALPDATDCRLRVLSQRASVDATSFNLWTAAGSASLVQHGGGMHTPTTTIPGALIAEESSTIACASLIDLAYRPVRAGSFAVIISSGQEEIVRVDSYNITTNQIVVARGVLDTVPVAHSAGARIWFAEQYNGADFIDYLNGDVVKVKIQTATHRGTLDIASAPQDTLTMTSRQNRPYPPGKFRVNSILNPATVSGTTIAAGWAHRNRLTQTATIIDQTTGDIGPESGVTYTATLTRVDTSAVLATSTGITGNSVSLTPTVYVGPVKLTVKAVRSALDSFTSQSCVFNWAPGLVYIAAQSSVTFSTVTTQNVAVPASAAVDDLLIAAVMHRAALSSVPSGWTLVDSVSFQDSTAQVQYVSIYSKTAVSGDLGASTAWTQSSAVRMAVQLLAARKTSGSGTPAVVGTPAKSSVSNTGNQTYTLPVVTATAAGQLAVGVVSTVVAASASPNTLTFSGSWAQSSPTSSTDTANQIRLGVAAMALASSGNVTSGAATGNFASSTNGWGAITLLLQ